MSNYLLQVKFVPWQGPFHFFGGRPNPLSLKLFASGHIPVSKTPTMMSLSFAALSTYLENPMKSHDLVVWSSCFLLGNTDTTPSKPIPPQLIKNRFSDHHSFIKERKLERALTGHLPSFSIR